MAGEPGLVDDPPVQPSQAPLPNRRGRPVPGRRRSRPRLGRGPLSALGLPGHLGEAEGDSCLERGLSASVPRAERAASPVFVAVAIAVVAVGP